MVFSSQVFLSLTLDILFNFTFLEFNPFSKFSNRHFFKETVATSFCRIKTFCTLNRYFLKFPDLSYKLLLSPHLNFIFIFLSLKSLFNLLVDLISYLSIFLSTFFHCLTSFILLAMDLFNNLDSFLIFIMQIGLPFFLTDICFSFHGNCVGFVLLCFHFLSNDCLFSCQLHFNLLSLYMIKTKDFITLIHFRLPRHELSFITLVYHQIFKTLLLCFFCLLECKSFTFNSRSCQFNWSFNLFKVWSRSRLLS